MKRSCIGFSGLVPRCRRPRRRCANPRSSIAFVLLIGVCGAIETPASDVSEDAGEQSVGTELCVDLGPQTPRDIGSTFGMNTAAFPLAPSASEMHLCNIHTHTNAEHKGPGFSIFVSSADDGGFACNGTPSLSEAELAPVPGAYQGVKPGDTIEAHWVHTSCETTPGEGLGACVPEACNDPLLRVEA